MDTTGVAQSFFAAYQEALLNRDAASIARHYAVPGLIAFPNQPVPITSQAQTEKFFTGAFGQYEGVTDASFDVIVVAATGHSIWADVTWSYNGGNVPGERNLYQLVVTGLRWQIAVVTPMRLSD